MKSLYAIVALPLFLQAQNTIHVTPGTLITVDDKLALRKEEIKNNRLHLGELKPGAYFESIKDNL